MSSINCKNVLLLLIICGVTGCTSFKAAYFEVNSYQQSRETDKCVKRATYYANKTYIYSNNELAEFYKLRGICYSQVGSYPEALNSFDKSVAMARKDEIKAQSLFQR